MSDPLYGMPVLRLAAAVADYPPLADPQAQVERRSPVCGSRVTVTVRVDEAGRASAIGIDARACALGQAAASVLAQGIIGRSADDIALAALDWSAYLAGTRATVPDWRGLSALAAGRDYPARHASLRLAFEAAAEAMAAAQIRTSIRSATA